MNFLSQPFGVVMKFIADYLAFGDYGLAIILFTLFVKILLLPLNIKQQKSMIRTQALQPELNALKEQCGNDKNLLMEEQQKLYQKYNVNPMSGCLPTLIQFPILIVVYNIIVQPLTYIAGLGSDAIAKLGEIAGITGKNSTQLLINAFFLNNPDKVTSEVTTILGGSKFVNMNFLGFLDLGKAPTECFKGGIQWALVPLLLIPIVTLLTQFWLQWLQSPNRKNKKDKKETDPTQRSMNLMLKLMPFVTFFIALTTPAGLGFYWAVSNLLTLVQTAITNKLIEKSQKEG